MRTAPLIHARWSQGGPFHGVDGKAHTRVTVQDPWDDILENPENSIFATSEFIGLMVERGYPLRWFQRYDNSQNEREVPNIKKVTIDRSIDADAGTCSIEIYNQQMYVNGEAPLNATELGQPGYFTPGRGGSIQLQARWGLIANEWEDSLTTNAILRTYQGYGGTTKTIDQAVADGNIMLTGIWLIDRIEVNSSGMMTLSCRDMMKLLIEQQLYHPIVPSSRYPLRYYRYVYSNRDILAAPATITSTSSTEIALGDKRTVFRDSAVDRWYPQSSPGSAIPEGGYVLHGHRAIDCLDGNPATYCISVGNSAPNRPFATDWWEFDCGEWMNAVYVAPWAGNYVMYVSVMENGAWQGSDIVPYTFSEMNGPGAYAVDTGADIPYVASFTVPHEQAQEYILPRSFNAQRVRVSFRNHTYSPWGPWYYRVGMREFRIRASSGIGAVNSTNSITIDPLFIGGDIIRDMTDQNRDGYLTVSSFWQIDPFGEARSYDANSGPAATSDLSTAIKHSYDALGRPNGYYVVDQAGVVTAYGEAVHYGDPATDGFSMDDGGWITSMAVSSEGGYWCMDIAGNIYAYGDTGSVGSTFVAPTQESIMYDLESHPLIDGVWAMDTNGQVTALGDVTDFGSYTDEILDHQAFNTQGTETAAVAIRCTYDGDGYWIMTDVGGVQAFGAAVDHGQISSPNPSTSFYDSFYEMFPSNSNDGYLLLRGDGQMYPLGDVDFFGAPIPGDQGQLRRDGNYRDYSDIVKELALWSGFLLYDEDQPDNELPAVFGNIESTGSFSEEPLPDEIFDKRPVIDAINELKEAVGYICFVDDTGGLRFESPNWWSQGNFNEIGERIYELPEIDERVNMITYSTSHDDEDLRSVIILSSENPDEAGTSTVTTRTVPVSAAGLKGLQKPAMWVNGLFQSEVEQQIMAELISLHIWFSQRIGNVTCAANPCIQINDQVRIHERQTADAYIHYVRGISSTHDLDTGEYTMTLQTNWLGDGDEWILTAANSSVVTAGTQGTRSVMLSEQLLLWLREHSSERVIRSLGLVQEPEASTILYGDGTPDEEEGQAEA